MPTEIHIELTPELTSAGITILRRYLAQPNQFSDSEWQQVRTAIDQLARSIVLYGNRRYSFERFYATFINGTYARPFLAQLQSSDNLQQRGAALQAENARKIVAWLLASGISPKLVPGADLLTVYCLYWWAAFARGYLFEQHVIRDLTDTGIHINAHQPEIGQQRYTQFDLTIVDLGNGDIKTSTYFLDDLVAPTADFYITRLYDSRHHRTRQVVFLSPARWRRINGEPQHGSITEAVDLFPSPVLVQVVGRAWVIADYEVWKELVLNWQKQRSKDE